MKRLLLGLLLMPVLALALPEVPDTERDRYQRMIHELRCLVCQNQSIAESDAPLAQDLRAQVARQIGEGRSDAEIRRYLTDRYGDFVLYKPPLRWRTALLWFGPFLLLALGLVIALRQARRRVPAGRVPVSAEALQRLLDKHGPRS